MQHSKRRKVEKKDSMDADDMQNAADSPSEEDYLLNHEIDQITEEEGGILIGGIYIPPAPAPALSFNSNGPRLMITHIVNENFKSYAGIQTLGPFHKCFTAIIGPNGSGKSNVIDSLLFVFGDRASKIRSKKLSVLIHTSSKVPYCRYTTVSVYFQQIIDGEGEAFHVVSGSEMVISRTAFKDNSSIYNLNGRGVQFEEIAEVLKSHGIDLEHNRFLILQGEVEQIAMMKPKGVNDNETGMLEYLEDIIGTSRFKEPLKQLAVKVDDYSAARKQKLYRVRSVETEKLRLEQPMKNAVELMNLTNNALRTRNMLLQKYIHEINKIIEEKEKELHQLQENLRKVDHKLFNVMTDLINKKEALKTGMQTFDKLKQQKEDVAEKLHTCEKKTVTALAELTHKSKKKNNLEQLLEQEKGKLMELELVPEKNKREIEDCEKLLAKHREAKMTADKELEDAIANVRNQVQGLQEQKDMLQFTLMDLHTVFHKANAQYKLTQTKIKLRHDAERNEAKKLAERKEIYEKVKTHLEEIKLKYEHLTSSLPEEEKKLEGMQNKLETLKKEEANFSREVRIMRSQVEEFREAISAKHSRGRVLETLMKEKRSGNIPGIFGRLGDLGDIDQKYDVAISTSCGSLDDIVVDTVETAQACLEFLKKNDIGRATFIALDKQSHLKNQTTKVAKYPEKANRLYDLVKVKDQRVLPAFYYALQDTLVADDLEQASRIAYGDTPHRVVSLEGDVIEIAGTMTGGGESVTCGRMSVQQDTSEQEELEAVQAKEKQLEEFEQRLTKIRTDLVELEDLTFAMQKSIRQAPISLQKFHFEIKSLEEQVPDLANQVKQQEEEAIKTKVDDKMKAEFEQTMSAQKVKVEHAQYDVDEMVKKVRAVDAEISTLASSKLNAIQKNVAEIVQNINNVSTEMTKLTVGISSSARNAKKSKDYINHIETDLEETDKIIESLNAQKIQLTLDTQQFQKELAELEKQISEETAKLSDLRTEISNLQTEENQIKCHRLDVNCDLNKMKKSVQDCTNKTLIWERELDSLQLEDPGLEGVPGLEPIVPFAEHTPEELEEAVVEELRSRLQAQKAKIGDNKPNIKVVQDYKVKEELYLRRAAELNEITQNRNETRKVLDQLTKKRTNEFMEGFNIITNKMKEMYHMFTLGGDADLELIDLSDAFAEGIKFSVRPPNKSWKNISKLSGGEKTLSSLALVFALHYYKPAPVYVMDEIDAALDFKNVSIVANYIKERTKNAQFIIISLRYNMFEVSNRLVGIYKTEDCTRSVCIGNRQQNVDEDDDQLDEEDNEDERSV